MADISDERLDDAINALLNHQKQLDMDGVIVGVSRQAIHEVVEALQARRAAEAKAVEALRKIAANMNGLSPRERSDKRRAIALAALGARND